MRLGRRTFVRTGLAGAASAATLACTTTPPILEQPPEPTDERALALFGNEDTHIEFFMKGLFLYVPYRNYKQIAQPMDDAHPLYFEIDDSVLTTTPDQNYWEKRTDPPTYKKRWRWKGDRPYSLDFGGADGVGGAGKPIPTLDNLCPDGQLNDSASWLDERFLVKLESLYGRGEPRLRDSWESEASFLVTLPAGAGWQPRTPLTHRQRALIFQFKAHKGDGEKRGITQAISDVVSFKTRYEEQLSDDQRMIKLLKANGSPLATIPLKKDVRGEVWIFSGPFGAEEQYPENWPMLHFLKLSQFFAGGYDVVPVVVGLDCAGRNDPNPGPPKRDGAHLPLDVDPASADVFCAGGEMPDQNG